MKKRWVSILLCLLMLISVWPGNVGMAKAISAEEMTKKFAELKKSYPQGTYWNKNYMNASECMGFALLVTNTLFNEDCRQWSVHGDVNKLCVGDHIRFRSVDWNHSITVTNIVGNKVYTVDCNGSAGKNTVGWNKTYTKSDIYSMINKPIHQPDNWNRSGYGYIQHQSGNNVKTLNAISKPSSPGNISLSASHTAVGNTITANWGKVSNASGYNVELICHNNSAHNRSVKVTGTGASFNLPAEGTYAVRVSAYNSADTSAASTSGTVTAHAPSNVTFVDYDDTVLNVQSVRYGEAAIAPAAPSREGYTFQGWDKGVQNITQPTTIKATYKINVYNVVFKDSDGKTISSQRVEHGSPAQAPNDPTPESGYVFVGWNYPNFQCVTENMTITAVYAWGNDDLPIVAEITKAARKPDSSGYDITVTTKNFPSAVTKAKVIVSLKTEENKMVASEMKQIYLNESENPTHNLFVSYEGVATIAEVETVGIVDDDKTGVPLSAHDRADIDLGLAWSNWSDAEPKNPNGDLLIETRPEYRYSDKEFKTSNTSAMAGYTLYNTTSQWGGWSGWSRNAVGASDTRQVNTRTIPATYQKRWTYCRWVNNAGNTSSYTGVYPNFQNIDLDYRLSAKGTVDGHTRYGSYSGNYGNYLANWWWHEGSYNKQTAAAYTEYQYRDLYYTYHFYKWGGWSDWTPEAIAATDNRQVETRTAYRYKSKAIKTPVYNYKRYRYTNPATQTDIYTYDTTYPDSMGYAGEWEYTESESELAVVSTVDYDVKLYNGYRGDSWYSAEVNGQGEKKTYITYKTLEDTSGETYTVSGAIAESGDGVDGKQATLLVYKGKNTDPTATQIEAIAQTTLTADGAYTFTFKTKEIPTADTGDFILMLGVEGATKPVYIDTIEAPKPEYKVIFVDGDTVLSEQTVKEGDSAIAPENLAKEGYTFVGWDTGLSNVHDDLTITANYIQNQYSVIFVDWNHNDIAIKTFGHGDVIQPPEPTEIEGWHFTQWQDIVDGQTIVTQNMVIMAEYQQNQYTVTFMNWDNTVIKEETVTHGEAVDIPEIIPEKEGMVFAGWSNSASMYSVAEPLTLYPVFEYTETTQTPSANIASGEITRGQRIALHCPSEAATLYYALVPGNTSSEELNFDADSLTYQEYTEPIAILEDASLVFYAVEDEKNQSSYVVETYTVASTITTNTVVRRTTSGLKFQVTCDSDIENATITAAVFDAGGRLLAAETQACDGVNTYILSTDAADGAAYATIMVWNGLDTMKPLGNSERVTIN